MRLGIFPLSIIFLISCSSLVVKIPIDILSYSGESNSSRLVILLRGVGNDIHYFDENGWVLLLQQHYPHYSISIPDLHLGYIREGIYFERLYEDVVKPAKLRGIQSIWLVGISLGGYGAIMSSEYAKNDIDRIYLISPYLGKGEVLDNIAKSNGLANWQGKLENDGSRTYDLWSYLKEISQNNQSLNYIYLAYGKDDEMKGLSYLADVLAMKNVVELPGGHRDWVFFNLFEEMINRGYLE